MAMQVTLDLQTDEQIKRFNEVLDYIIDEDQSLGDEWVIAGSWPHPFAMITKSQHFKFGDKIRYGHLFVKGYYHPTHQVLKIEAVLSEVRTILDFRINKLYWEDFGSQVLISPDTNAAILAFDKHLQDYLDRWNAIEKFENPPEESSQQAS